MTDKETKKAAEKVKGYLIKKLGTKIGEKFLDKLAKRLGVSTFLSFIKLEHPYKKVMDATGFTFKIMYFSGYYSTNSQYEWNPYDPKDKEQEEQYIEYLIYSWANGKPGYKYQFDGVFK